MSNIELNLVDCGRREPAVVLIHGFTCNLHDWKEQLSVLSAAHRCVAIDLPGHGKSPPPEEPTIEALAKAVNDALDALKLSDVVLVGHSMGCRLVSETYGQSPGRVRGVVYVDGSMVAVGNPDEAVRKMIETLDRIGMDGFIERLYEGFYVEGTPTEVRDFVNAGLSNIDMNFARKLWLNVVRWDASRAHAALGAIEVPALVIQSTYLNTEMKRVSIASGQTTPWINAVSEAVKDVTVAVIEGVGHFPMLEAPQQTNEAISSFVHRIAAD
ncbi:MAG: alpha/beta hydrolase [Betaproteobacteria bacterium]|nr:MAG: alpha/beta hydrolase [Betaproteobacteria bacterium]